MHALTICGLALCAAATLFDRLIRRLPAGAAIALYAAAALLMIAGMAIRRFG